MPEENAEDLLTGSQTFWASNLVTTQLKTSSG